MPKKSAITDLRKQEISDLRSAIVDKRREVAGLRLGVKTGTSKQSSKYLAAKKELAQLLTVLTEKQRQELPEKQKTATMSASPAQKRKG